MTKHLCDGALGANIACNVTLVCACGRCCREQDDERFHTCATHQVAASTKHMKMRERLANWVAL
jgi:hypothetical protein